MPRRRKGEPLKVLISAKVEPVLIESVRVAAAERQVTLTKAIEDGLELWLKREAEPDDYKKVTGKNS